MIDFMAQQCSKAKLRAEIEYGVIVRVYMSASIPSFPACKRRQASGMNSWKRRAYTAFM